VTLLAGKIRVLSLLTMGGTRFVVRSSYVSNLGYLDYLSSKQKVILSRLLCINVDVVINFGS